jgi:prophage maintenance system killer protein
VFERHKSTISRHLANAFAHRELERKAVVAKNATTAADGKIYEVDYYNLDAILSVGYRVNSRRGTQFRQWANRVLKEHLVKDFKKREEEASLVRAGLKNIELLARTAASDGADTAEVLSLIERYARSWHLLLQYDEKKLPPPSEQKSKKMARLTPRQATKAVEQFKRSLAQKGQATDLFGRLRGDGLDSILGNLEQTWSGEPVYPNVPIRAAHLLYFVIKNHPFFDGNKRIGSLLFLHYLEKNHQPLLADSALVALALLIAESDPKQKDLVVRLIISLMQETPRAPAEG